MNKYKIISIRLVGDASDVDALLEQGVFLIEKERYTEALGILDGVLEMTSGTCALAYYHKGRAHLRLGNEVDANAMYVSLCMLNCTELARQLHELIYG